MPVSGSQFGDYATIHQDVYYYAQPHRQARVVRVIPPRNAEVIHRPDLVSKLDKLLPRAPEHYSAALWGLGGSGKTQLALDYVSRRCSDDDCSVFWVHADSEATFTHDYATIARRLEIKADLRGADRLLAVRDTIESLSQWVLVLDNADDLTLFGGRMTTCRAEIESGEKTSRLHCCFGNHGSARCSRT
ncbi:hypothetical protein BKA56DRAFT_603960 [Ilyonectria sp. MPI-CAGE-AT-0026]|nr:hypothetical protein BKA56DRAFT_603960 [Ilyonectria sp. MPI-CAGE-AT-0026]